MAITRNFILNGLLQKSFFPFQKRSREELPPVFDSHGLTKDIAEKIRKVSLSGGRKRDGFDSIQYKATRFNNVPRLLTIPHPKPYIDTCFELYDNWPKIKYVCSNQNSLIRPKKHHDGRVIIMDYEKSYDRRNRYYDSAFGKKFLVHTDIANCFPSLYSHAVPWALIGFDKAKKNRDPREWFNKIDFHLRSNNRNETSGVPIGPAISNIMCEIILARIDDVLKKRFSYIRFIDDYTAYCKTHEEAEEFIRCLSLELLKYRFNINIKKTEIEALPQPMCDLWLEKLKEIIPNNDQIVSARVSSILDAAVRLQKSNPDGSILKYAGKSIVKKLDHTSSFEFCKYILKLAFHYPVLIPLVKNPFEEIYSETDFKRNLVLLLKESIKYYRSDAICWLLYYLLIYKEDISDRIANNILETRDCLSIVLLSEFSAHLNKTVSFARGLQKGYLYELDNYWLLLYQLFLKGRIQNPYKDGVFEILKRKNVSFVNY